MHNLGTIKKKQAQNLPFLPIQLADAMRLRAQTFDEMALAPLQQFPAELNHEAGREAPVPDLQGLERMSERMKEDLAALSASTLSLNQTLEGLGADPAESLARLEEQMQAERAEAVAHELGSLSDSVAGVADDLQWMERNQQQELNELANATPLEVAEAEKMAAVV